MAYRYTNLNPTHRPHGPGAILRWGVVDRLLGRRRPQPPGPPAPIVEPDFEFLTSDTTEPWLIWLGHASFLGSLRGHRFLIDPLLSPHAGWVYRRSLPPPIEIEQLPDITAVMVTHNHYDHLDAGFYSRLGDDVTVVVPLGMSRWMRQRGRTRVIELGWWQQAVVGDLVITLVPACHWSRRGVFDTNRVLWGGYVIEDTGHSFYHSGDTASFKGFAEIGRRFPKLDAAMLPIGGYQPPWFMEHYHLNPEQAGEAFLDLGAQHLVPMHWGTIQLTDEPLCEPIERMRSWWETHSPTSPCQLDILDVGGSLKLDGRSD